jgi:hypothetical protein
MRARAGEDAAGFRSFIRALAGYSGHHAQHRPHRRSASREEQRNSRGLSPLEFVPSGGLGVGCDRGFGGGGARGRAGPAFAAYLAVLPGLRGGDGRRSLS